MISTDTGLFLEKHDVHRKAKPTEQHATMVERHNSLVRRLLHVIYQQSTEEGLKVDVEDIIAETTYAKNNMLEIGGVHPITAVLGIKPKIMPDLEATENSKIHDLATSLPADPDVSHAGNRQCMRLRELAVAAMVQATAQSRIDIANKTQTRPDGR